MAKDSTQSGILGDINPKPGTEEHVRSRRESELDDEDDTIIFSGSPYDRPEHSGSRDVTEGVTAPVE